jgi:uncharacterized protein (TIGR00251 family)
MRDELPTPQPGSISSAATWRREDAGTVVLALHVQPGAKRTEIAGVHGEGKEARLKIRLAALPVEGKANVELLRFLAAAFGVRLAAVTLERGETSRNKTVRIERPVRRPDFAWETAGA